MVLRSPDCMHEQVGQAVVKQAKGRGIRLGGCRVVQQVNLAQVPTGGADLYPEEVGFHFYRLALRKQLGIRQSGFRGAAGRGCGRNICTIGYRCGITRRCSDPGGIHYLRWQNRNPRPMPATAAA